MVSDILKSVFDFMKLAPRYFIALGITSAFLIFSPEKTLKIIGVFDLAKNYRPWFGVIFLLSSALVVVTIAVELAKRIKSWWIKRKLDKGIEERLFSLTEDEKKILRFYIYNQTKTNVLRIDDGVVKGLVSAGVIFRSAEVGSMLEGFAHNISDFAWYYLNIYPSLLEGPTDECRTDKIRRLFR